MPKWFSSLRPCFPPRASITCLVRLFLGCGVACLPSAEPALRCGLGGRAARGQGPALGRGLLVTRLLIALKPELRRGPFSAARPAGPALSPACRLPPGGAAWPPPPRPGCGCRRSRPSSACRGSTHRCSRPPRTRKASALRTSALTGQTLDCSFTTESVKNNWEERGRDPLQRQLISKGRGASPGEPAPTQAVQVGAPVHGRLPSHARCRLRSRVSDSRWLKRPRQVAVTPNDDRPSWVRRPASFDPDPDALSAHRSALATPPPPVLPRWQRPPVYVLPHSHQTTACGLGWQNTADPTSVTGLPPPAVPGGLGVLGPGVESPPAKALSREAGWRGSRGGHWAVRYSH